uniref:CX domain-containing protein n=1 Tax=Panagrellus redivivus TaxID=6233 RepID=A0A7E4ZU65_PANRE
MALIRTLLGTLVLLIGYIGCSCEDERSRCVWFETSPEIRIMNVSLIFDSFEGMDHIISMMYDVPISQGCFRTENSQHSVTICCCAFASNNCSDYYNKLNHRHLSTFEPPSFSGLHWQHVPDTRPPKWTIFILVGLVVICITLIVMIILLLTYLCGCPCYHTAENNNPAVIPPVPGTDNPTPQPVTPLGSARNGAYPGGMCPIPQTVPIKHISTTAKPTKESTNTISIDGNGKTNVEKSLKKGGATESSTTFTAVHDETMSDSPLDGRKREALKVKR